MPDELRHSFFGRALAIWIVPTSAALLLALPAFPQSTYVDFDGSGGSWYSGSTTPSVSTNSYSSHSHYGSSRYDDSRYSNYEYDLYQAQLEQAQRRKELKEKIKQARNRSDLQEEQLLLRQLRREIASASGGIIGILFDSSIVFLIPLISSMKAVVPLWAVIVGFSVSVTIGLVFGVWPATKAAKLNPVEALRYE